MNRTLALSITMSLVAVNGWAADSDSKSPRVSTQLRSEHEIPAVSSPARGTFKASIDAQGTSINYELTFDGLQALITMAHIHMAQPFANGAIVVWLCGTPGTNTMGPTGTQTCPESGTVTGTILPEHIQTVPAQGIATGEFEELVAAIRRGLTYVNVHTVQSPAGEIRGQLGRRGHDDHD